MEESPFLKMHRFGPYFTTDRNQMETLAALLKVMLPYAAGQAEGFSQSGTSSDVMAELAQGVRQVALDDPFEEAAAARPVRQTRSTGVRGGRHRSPVSAEGRAGSGHGNATAAASSPSGFDFGQGPHVGAPRDSLMRWESSTPTSPFYRDTSEQALTDGLYRPISLPHPQSIRREASHQPHQAPPLPNPGTGDGRNPTPAYPRPVQHIGNPTGSRSPSQSPSREGRAREPRTPLRSSPSPSSASRSSSDESDGRARPQFRDHRQPLGFQASRVASNSPLRHASKYQGRGP